MRQEHKKWESKKHIPETLKPFTHCRLMMNFPHFGMIFYFGVWPDWFYGQKTPMPRFLWWFFDHADVKTQTFYLLHVMMVTVASLLLALGPFWSTRILLNFAWVVFFFVDRYYHNSGCPFPIDQQNFGKKNSQKKIMWVWI